MKFALTSNKNPSIEITPLIDIVFILVIFFVATSKITDSQFLDLDLPATGSFNAETSSISNQIYVFNDNIGVRLQLKHNDFICLGYGSRDAS